MLEDNLKTYDTLSIQPLKELAFRYFIVKVLVSFYNKYSFNYHKEVYYMKRLKIEPAVTDAQILTIAGLAKEIWQQHFTPIIGAEQVAYMLERFQSYPALKEQLGEGYEYFLLNLEGTPIGYSGIHQEDKTLFLSKIYIKKAHRGNGYSSQVIDFYTSLCRERGLSLIWLTCNKNNTNSIGAYEHMGFRKTRTQVADIGNGFVMDDYIMEKKL